MTGLTRDAIASRCSVLEREMSTSGAKRRIDGATRAVAANVTHLTIGIRLTARLIQISTGGARFRVTATLQTEVTRCTLRAIVRRCTTRGTKVSTGGARNLDGAVGRAIIAGRAQRLLRWRLTEIAFGAGTVAAAAIVAITSLRTIGTR